MRPHPLARPRGNVITMRGTYSFPFSVRDTPEGRERGMMFQTSSPTMPLLFVFPAPGRIAMWMRNTLVPLDVIFINQAGFVVQISGGKPLDETSITGGTDVQFVLETTGGWARAIGLGVGDRMRFEGVRIPLR